MRGLRSRALLLARAAIWPLYLILLAYAARVGPWPRSVGILASALVTAFAMTLLVFDLLRSMVGASAVPGAPLPISQTAARQLEGAGRFLVVAALVFVLPVYLFDNDLIAPEGRPVAAPALGRLLAIGYELVVWATCVRLLRKSSVLWAWLAPPSCSSGEAEPVGVARIDLAGKGRDCGIEPVASHVVAVTSRPSLAR